MGTAASKKKVQGRVTAKLAALSTLQQIQKLQTKGTDIMNCNIPLSKEETAYLKQIESGVVELKNSKSPWDEDGQETLYKVLEVQLAYQFKYAEAVGNILHKHNFLDVAVRIWDHCHTTDDADEHYYHSKAYEWMKMICWNCSHKCLNICQAAYKQEKLIDRWMREFTLSETPLADLEDNHARRLMTATMAFLHNSLRKYNPIRKLVRKNGGIQKILKFHQSSYVIIKAEALLILAYCIDEEENDQIMTGAGVIQFFANLLARTVQSPNHLAQTDTSSDACVFSAIEIVMGLNKFALNDNNKLYIVEAGVISMLAKMLDDDFSLEEQAVALECIWTLSFLKENKQPIKKEPFLLNSVRRLAKDPKSDDKMKRSCEGILFVIEGKREAQPKISKTEHNSDSKSHIMISYQWDVQDTILEFRTMLQEHGHKVWLDVDKMEGSILSAMADAVENASVIVIAITEKYKNSSPCRTEAEYAYKLKKPTVFLLLEPGYNPNQWLGAMLGTQLYYDISVHNWQETKFPSVLQRIKSKTSPAIVEKVKENVVVVDAPAKSSAPQKSRHTGETNNNVACCKWSKMEVTKWAKGCGLEKLSPLISSFDGPDLEGLIKILNRSPDIYYTCVKTEFKLNLLDMIRFTNALESL